MIIINSAAYIIPELKTEFGLIPPVFLPIGNKKLLSYQVKELQSSFLNEKIVVSLPDKYQLNLHEKKLIAELNIEVVFVPETLTLGMAILYVINLTGVEGNTLRLLHGDTLINDFPVEDNCIALSYTNDDYNWEFDESLVWCGYFSFDKLPLFIRTLASTQGNFVDSVHSYSRVNDINYCKINGWFDLGHVNTYFRSRTTITTQRAFNSLKIEKGIVYKTGPSRKIEAEANWFKKLPINLKIFIPQLIDYGEMLNGEYFYKIEYLPLLPLNEIYVHGKNIVSFWDNILNLIANFMDESRKSCVVHDDLKKQIHEDSVGLYQDKTHQRLQLYAKQTNLDLDGFCRYNGKNLPSINEITNECVIRSLKLPKIMSVLHGDLCFSNVLFNSRMNNIKVIDPRGLNRQEELSIFGNQTYDLAKLCHSFIGLYDFIIADCFELVENDELGTVLTFNIDERFKQIQNKFMKKELIPDIDNKDIIAPTILLFLSMLPLHFDNPRRQKAMLSNALRLYIEMSDLDH